MQHELSFSESKRLCRLAAWQKEEENTGENRLTEPNAISALLV